MEGMKINGRGLTEIKTSAAVTPVGVVVFPYVPLENTFSRVIKSIPYLTL
jgi:hypothetical protein